MVRRTLVLAAAALLVTGIGVLRASQTEAAAGGSGPAAFTLTADCGEAGTFDAVINLHAAAFSPAHSGHQVFMPIAFDATTIVFTDAAGHQTTNVDPAITKGASSHVAADIVTCSFAYTIPFPDGSTLSASGTAHGFITPVGG